MNETDIKHTELTFQLIVESAPNAIVLVNKEGKIAYVNGQTERLFRYPRTELIGQKVELLIPRRYHDRHPNFRNMFFVAPSVRAMGAGRELFAARSDGSEFPIEIGLNPIVTVDGTLVLASIIDISERKKADERFRLVVESAPNAMVLINHEGVIALVNSQTEALFGYKRNELIGERLEMLIPERYRSNHPNQRQNFFATPKTRAMGAGRNLFALRKDGTEVQVEIGLNPIETDEGQMVLASIIDITEQKIQEASMKKQMQLEIKNKELEQFAYIASHDLQEPLRTVSNYIQVLEEDYGNSLDPQAIQYLGTIHRATLRMSALVRALLSYSRLGRNGKAVDIDLNKILEEVITDLNNVIANSGARVIVSPMPTIHGYETEIRQLFQNLIINAIKFRRENVPPRIEVGCEVATGKRRFFVRDNGIGIEATHFERIFQIFQRVHANAAAEGYGIGLANCKKIVEVHGGEISVESTPGTGSTFRFTLVDIDS